MPKKNKAKMNNTRLIKTLKYILKTQPTELKLQKYTVGQILTSNPTYNQLAQMRKIVSKHNWEVNIIDGDRKKAYNDGLKQNYYILINDMMMDVSQGKAGESLNKFLINYKF
jgi:hypothetical protein